MRRNRVCQTPGLINPRQRCQHLRGYFFTQADIFFKLLYCRFDQRQSVSLGHRIRLNLAHRRNGKLLIVINRQHGCPVAAFHQHFDGAVGEFEQLQNVGDSADLIQVVCGRLVI